MNEEGNGFRSLGTFAGVAAAKAAVENVRIEKKGKRDYLAGAA